MQWLSRSSCNLVLGAMCGLALAGGARAAEPPAGVAARFVEALAIRNYAEVVACVYEPWMYGELDSLCAERPGVSIDEREDCARSLGASSLNDLAATPRERFVDAWARLKWPFLFPPEPPSPPAIDQPQRRWPECIVPADPFPDPSQLIVRTAKEVIDSPYEAFVELSVRLQSSFRELKLDFAMNVDVNGEWRIAGVRSELVSE